MNSIFLIIVAVVVFLIAYTTYGAWLCKKWGIDSSKPTPAHTRYDKVDFCPAKVPVLLGHHFSSIAGAGPIVGPISAAIFGWVPVFLWIILGSIFFGGVHDMGALFSSVRHGGRSIAEVINDTMGQKGKRLFSIFAWLTLLLVVSSFTNIVANTFVSVPSAATASMLFIILAIGFGFFVYRRGTGLVISSVIGVALLFVCIWLGIKFPINISKNVWTIILLIYVFVASVTPVWILLQPRDYLNSFLLYAMMIGGILGIIIKHPALKMAPVTSFNVNGSYLFPILFVTVACGAISGFHSLVGSGTSSKQIDSEKDIKAIGYGSMLIEGVLAVVSIITAAYLGADKFEVLLHGEGGSPVNVFSNGLGVFMNGFGVPIEVGTSFTALAVSAFALTSLDTSCRLARFIVQEAFERKSEGKKEKTSIFANRYFATFITVLCGGILTLKGWSKIWVLLGSANQLLAAIALLSLALWLKKLGKEHRMATIPMIFMFAVTLTALVLLIKANLSQPILLILSIVLLILSLDLIVEAVKSFKKMKQPVDNNVRA